MRLRNMSENEMIELSRRGLLNGQSINKLNLYEHFVFRKQMRVKFTKAFTTQRGHSII